MVKFEKLNIDSVAKIKKRVIAVIIALAVSSGLYVDLTTCRATQHL